MTERSRRATGRVAAGTRGGSTASANGSHPDVHLNGRRRPGARSVSLAEPPVVNGKPTLATASVPPQAKSAPVAAAKTPKAPAQKAAAKKTPAKTAPAKTAPAKTAPAETAPAKTAPAKTAPAKPGPAKTATKTAEWPTAERKYDVWDERVAGILSFLRRRLTGQYDVDEFGFDPELTQTFVYPVLRLFYRHYFRIETTGIENLSPDGSALIVANHSGTLPMDAMMLTMAVHDETPQHRHLRLLGADLLFRIPVLSELARKAGSTLACNPDAERLLSKGEYVGVFPEGFKGIGKAYRDRYKLQRFGRGGFVSAALRTGTPIVPVSIVGAEEIYPIIGNVQPLAKITGLPYVPVTPLFPWFGPLGMLPLPSKWLIHFGEPIETAPYRDEADDPIVVFNLADQVRETIQQTLHTMLERRPDPFAP